MNNRTDKKQDWRSTESATPKSTSGRDASTPETDKRSGQRTSNSTPNTSGSRATDSSKSRDQNSRR